MAPGKTVSSISPPHVRKIGKFFARWLRKQVRAPSVSDEPLLLHGTPAETTIARRRILKIHTDVISKKRSTRELYNAVSAKLGGSVSARMVQKVIASTFEVMAEDIQRHGECTLGKFMKLEGEIAKTGKKQRTSFSVRMSSGARLNKLVHGRTSAN